MVGCAPLMPPYYIYVKTMPNKRKLSKQERRHYYEQMLRRYTKQRQRNAAAAPGCQQMIFVLDHLKAGFNVAKIFRSGESFVSMA